MLIFTNFDLGVRVKYNIGAHYNTAQHIKDVLDHLSSLVIQAESSENDYEIFNTETKERFEDLNLVSKSLLKEFN